jgi:hypothetical protein
VSAIKPNDLVYVARDCCGEYVGVTFFVGHIRPAPIRCTECAFDTGPEAVTVVSRTDGGEGIPTNFPISWLRKIDPDVQPEDVQREESVNA